jgi:phosphoenolpyruvate carboxylase
LGISGLIKASRCLIEPPPEDRKDYLGIMDELARYGEEAYRKLTRDTEGFLDYFYECTPLDGIALLNIGSRPSHRKKADRSLKSIRAIPWVFGWAQSRQTLPAWFGIGYAIERYRGNDLERLVKLQKMYQEWPYFRALLSNTQMSLFKAEMHIARAYARLAENQEQAEAIYGIIEAEYERTLVAGHECRRASRSDGGNAGSSTLAGASQYLSGPVEPYPGRASGTLSLPSRTKRNARNGSTRCCARSMRLRRGCAIRAEGRQPPAQPGRSR